MSSSESIAPETRNWMAPKKYRMLTINIGVTLSWYWNMYEWIERAGV